MMVVGSRLQPLALGCSGVYGLIRVNLHDLEWNLPSCPEVTLRYGKSIWQHLCLFLGSVLFSNEYISNALKTTKQCENMFLRTDSVYEREYFFV